MNTIFKKEMSLQMVDFPASYFRLQEGVQFDQIDRLGLGQVSSLLGYIMEVMAEPMAAQQHVFREDSYSIFLHPAS